MDNNRNSAQITNGEDRSYQTWAMLCHAAGLVGLLFIPSIGNIVAPLVLWLLKKEEHPFIDEQGKEALNFQISMTIYLWVSGLLCFILIGFALLPILGLFAIIVCIIAIVKTSDGVGYTYPLTLRFIK